MSVDHRCPLCAQIAVSYWQDPCRHYLGCDNCGLVHVPRDCWLTAEEEKAIYDLHDNRVDDQGYRRFLSRIYDPLQALLAENSVGLDFGCGPGPALASMFQDAGHQVSLFDIFYYPDTSVLDNQFDFITATEVVEHLSRPRIELERLWGCLKPGGLMGIMTKKVRDKKAFGQWHYKNDLTHICFFSESSFEYLCSNWQAKLVYSAADVVIFKKS